MRFIKSRRCYIEARYQLSKNGAEGVIPDLESYIEQRREASGWRMALDMVQYAGDAHVPDTFLGDVLLGKLHDHACDIAAWSEVCLSLFLLERIWLLMWMFLSKGHCIVCQGRASEQRGKYRHHPYEGAERTLGVRCLRCGDARQAKCRGVPRD